MSLDSFTTWAQLHGLKFTHIFPRRTLSSGLGFTATTPLKPSRNDIAFCPHPLLLTRTSARRFSPPLPSLPASISTHAVLALAISQQLRNTPHPWRAWVETWPPLSEFRRCLPLLWGPQEWSLLPPSTRMLVKKQRRKFEADLRAVGDAVKGEGFEYAWSIVNTRTLYYGKGEMCLSPGIDLFNHSARPTCDVRLSARGYHVTARGECGVGEEVTVSYGAHDNDFLLVEYGFLLAENGWDGVRLDPTFEEWRGLLEEAGWWGGYVLGREGVCFRSQVAVRVALGEAGWRGFAGGVNEGREEQEKVDRWILEMLGGLRAEGEEARGELTGLEREEVRDTIKMRWKQVLEIVDSAERCLRKVVD